MNTNIPKYGLTVAQRRTFPIFHRENVKGKEIMRLACSGFFVDGQGTFLSTTTPLLPFIQQDSLWYAGTSKLKDDVRNKIEILHIDMNTHTVVGRVKDVKLDGLDISYPAITEVVYKDLYTVGHQIVDDKLQIGGHPIVLDTTTLGALSKTPVIHPYRIPNPLSTFWGSPIIDTFANVYGMIISMPPDMKDILRGYFVDSSQFEMVVECAKNKI